MTDIEKKIKLILIQVRNGAFITPALIQIVIIIDEEVSKLGKTKRGKRDGTGPFKGSFQEKTEGIGRRKKAGQKCPKK